MKHGNVAILAFLLVLSLIALIFPACTPVQAAESYMAVIPKVLYSGSTGALSLALFSGGTLVVGRVEVALLKDGKVITKVKQDVSGKGTIKLNVPDVDEGNYEIQVKGPGFENKAQVKVERSFLVFLETDKPIYKPGQTINIRVLTLDAELKPVSEPVTVEVLDAKGIKIFRSEVHSDEFGMANLELPISNEPNLGVWKVTAITEKANTQLDVRVEKYVLPKYEIKAELSREWFLVNEPIKGKISAEYSFGKLVSGELEIKASRYVGQWQEYTTLTKSIDGQVEFQLPAVGYVAGVPGASGMGNVILDITVREKATGYEEKTSRLLTVAQSATNLQIIPESIVFKPGLPFSFLLITETPGNDPVDAQVKTTITYLDSEYKEIKEEIKTVQTVKGKAIVDITPPENAVAIAIESSADGAQASKIVTASYSPSGNFIHVEQISEGIPKIGEEIIFRVYSTKQAVNFYYEIISRGRVIFSDFTKSRDIAFNTTLLMAPSSQLLVYQILPNSEVAADSLPFKVEAQYSHSVTVEFSKPEAKPGEKVSIDIRTEGESKVGIVAVDRSVFILAENRLNLQQVFDELERLYMQPQVELHEVSIYPSITTMGAKDIFEDAGVVVLSNNKVPEGKQYQFQGGSGIWDKLFHFFNGGRDVMVMEGKGAPVPAEAPPTATPTPSQSSGLAEVQRVRQYFPETWLWSDVITSAGGRASVQVTVPDTITTWMLRAVAISKDKGLGMAEDELRAFQPFFLSVDLPYAAIRGEEFPVRIAIYNYLQETQSVVVQIEKADWFGLLDESEKTVDIKPNDIGGVEFKIKPTKLGINGVKITARSPQAADAVIKTLVIEPGGVSREMVENVLLSDGATKTLDTSLPLVIVDGSGRVYLTLTSSYLTQTIEGLEGLIQMPFGCGEQNMIMLAPDIYITKYLLDTGQLKPEIMAKAEKLMITGYQRELTYRRSDGSFSAFGESDEQGSLWLTAFVLKCFAQAKGLIYVDESVLDRAIAWIIAQQNKDGSFDPIGFVHHQEMVGGVQGKTALTAYVAIALLEAGENTASAKAIDYLEGQLGEIDDPYGMTITAYALELAESEMRDDAHQKLMEMAQEDENGLHWGSGIEILPQPEKTRFPVDQQNSTEIEATGYATLALIEHGDAFNASRAAKWLVSKRNAYGGFGSTQDTVVALQALTSYSTDTRADVDLTVSVKGEGIDKKVKITKENFDVLQMIELPIDKQIEVSVAGKGEAIAQMVKRFNLPEAEKGDEILKVSVDYDVTQVEVDDLVKVSVKLEFNPPIPMEAGMVVLDVSVPTGFAPVTDSIAQAVQQQKKIKRYDIAGRKVIFYIENMLPGDKISFTFNVKAMYPVKAQGVVSQAYSYYKPEIRGETLSKAVTVR
jgi:CD109 antigen